MTVPGPAELTGRGGDPTIPLPWRDVPTSAFDGAVSGNSARWRYAPPGYGAARRPRRRHRFRKVLRRTVGMIVSLAVLAAIAFGGLMLVTPSVGNAESLARAQDAAHHVAYPGPPVASRFVAALVATEDHRFYSEPGIDLFAVARVGLSYATGHGDTGGATIYQQLAKLLYTAGRSGASVEAEQVALAVKLYLTYSKQQILQMYADVVYFGNGYYGLAAASCGYFGVRPASLSWSQAALLAGLVQAPSADDPVTEPSNARAREVHVIGRLVATGQLTPAQGRSALAVPLSALLAGANGVSGCSG
jgi:membrane peptidoglycan carboxypeptidase